MQQESDSFNKFGMNDFIAIRTKRVKETQINDALHACFLIGRFI